MSKSNQFIPGWPNSHAPKATPESMRSSSIHEDYLDIVPLNELQQGELYIIKIKLIAIALFQGWDDEMCCFSILRTDLLEELKWSEARYLPNNFDAYLAFDYAGNPPIHLWTKQLRAVIPINWFNIFEEARHMQRQWNVSFWDQPMEDTNAIEQGPLTEEDTKFYSLMDSPVPQDENDEQENPSEQYHNGDEELNEVVPKENKYYSSPQKSKIMSNPSLFLSESPTYNEVPQQLTSSDATTPAMRLQKQYNVTQQQMESQQQIETVSKPATTPPSQSIDTNKTIEKRPEIKQRRSFSSFFLKKKKSKKSLNEESSTPKKDTKRKSAPPTPSINEKYNNRKKSLVIEELSDEPTIIRKQVPPLTTSSSNSSTEQQVSSDLKTPKSEPSSGNKLELFDAESYFDMQATFAFLNSSIADNFSLMESTKPALATN